MRSLSLAILVAVLTSSCIPVIAGGLIYKSSKNREQKQEFMAQLQRTNAEREQKGLEPLDWCSEAYRFDKGWAAEDPNCAKKIKAYQSGDTTALDPPGAATSE